LRTIRSSFALLILIPLAASGLTAGGGEAEIRRAAALIDYVARGYGAAVVEGRVVNPVEYEEQQAFAQEAAEILERQPVGRPFAGEARALEAAVRARAAGAAVPAQALSIDRRLLEAAGLATTPPPNLQVSIGPILYGESCAACHGLDGRGDGFAASALSTPPTGFTGKDRAALTPYRVYSAITWGVPRTAMPAFDAQSEQRRWLMALQVLTFGHSLEDARRGEALAQQRGLSKDAPLLVARSDEELQTDFTARGFSPADARDLLAWVRRIAPFAGPPPVGFPALREQISIATSRYVHGNLAEAQARLREAERAGWTPLEPLVRETAPEQVAKVREAFAQARAQMAVLGANTRLLGATALLSRRIAEAGPVTTPAPQVLQAAGLWAGLRQAGPAALVLLAALLAMLQGKVLLKLAGAGAAAVAAVHCAAALARTSAAVAAVWPDAGPELLRAAILTSCALAALALAAAAALRRPALLARVSGACALAIAAVLYLRA
jgi:high-affinity iron transporter